MAGLRVQIRKNCLPDIAGATGPAARQGLAATLDRMRARARANARVDTGKMRATTQVQGGTTLVAPMYYSGFQNYGTRRGIVGDHWFSGAVEAESGRIAETVHGELTTVIQCG